MSNASATQTCHFHILRNIGETETTIIIHVNNTAGGNKTCNAHHGLQHKTQTLYVCVVNAFRTNCKCQMHVQDKHAKHALGEEA